MSRWNVRTITKGSDDESCSLSDVQVQTRHGRSVKPPSKYKQGLCLGLTMTPPPKKKPQTNNTKKKIFFFICTLLFPLIYFFSEDLVVFTFIRIYVYLHDNYLQRV